MLSSFHDDARARSITRFEGTGRAGSNEGVLQTSVPVESFPCSQILHVVSCGASAYSPLLLSHKLQFGELGVEENFPFSHSKQSRDPWKEVNPAGHDSQISDGGSVPTVPAGHASEFMHCWPFSLHSVACHPLAMLTSVEPSPPTIAPFSGVLQSC